MASVDVGDLIEVTYTTTTGATVTVTWIDPAGVTAADHTPVAEQPAGSGQFPSTFLANAPGVWEALYTASGAATGVERYYVRVAPITGPPPLATTGEVGAQFGTLTPAQESLAGTLVRAASKLVRSRFPLIDTQIANGVVDAEVVALAIVGMVLRVLRNPSGLRAETVGPFSRTYDTTSAAGLLAITPEDEKLLKPSPARYPKASTIMARPGLAPWPHGIREWIRRG